MREFDALREYPQPKEPRYVEPNIKTIKNRIIASYRDEGYYDGDRDNGYGGFKYDGRENRQIIGCRISELSKVIEIPSSKELHRKPNTVKSNLSTLRQMPLEP